MKSLPVEIHQACPKFTRSAIATWLIVSVAIFCLAFCSREANGYELGGRWTRTATNGTNVGTQGSPLTLTWSLAPDGTTLPASPDAFDGNDNPILDQSNLIDFYDQLVPTAGALTGDLTQRAWFPIFDDSFGRIDELSGITFEYEPNDDGSQLFRASLSGGFFSGPRGSLGTRGDIRLAGQSIDGSTGANTLGFSFGANVAEQVLDTDNGNFFGNAGSDFLLARNIITHEVFHGLGVEHVISSDDRFLLNPFISNAFDGPQLDDILALQRNYGDPLEESLGNDSAATSTPLGVLPTGGQLIVGEFVDSTLVLPSQNGFVSIDDNLDLDYYRFEVSGSQEVNLVLTPEGVVYDQAPQTNPATAETPLDASALSDLSLSLFLDVDGSGVPVASSDRNGAGGSEIISETLQPGTYYVQVSGADDDVQLYSLVVSAIPEPTSATVLAFGVGVLAVRRRRRR